MIGSSVRRSRWQWLLTLVFSISGPLYAQDPASVEPGRADRLKQLRPEDASERAPATTTTAVGFARRTVAAVLADYEALGHSFIFSSDVLTPSRVFAAEPPPGDALRRLDAALRELGAALRAADNDHRWLIVPYAPGKPVPLLGRVIDADTGEPLHGVLVAMADVREVTDPNGLFQLQGVARAQPLRFQLDGYGARTLRPPKSHDGLLDVTLRRVTRLEEMVVVASRYALEGDNPSFTNLDRLQLEQIPELGDDALRAVNHLPGTASVGLSARPNVRGGAPDETLVLFNNVELLEPFHLRDFHSIFSGVNPNLVDSISVYTGGFPARYGDRMSAVIDIAPTQAYPPFGGELTLSLLTASAALYGDLGDERGRWALTARRGNLDLVAKQIDSSLGRPAYSDWFGQWVLRFGDGYELDAGVLAFADDVTLRELNDQREGASVDSSYENVYGWLQLGYQGDDGFSQRSGLSVGRIRHRREGFVNDPDPDESVGVVDDKRRFQLFQLSHRINYRGNEQWAFEAGTRLAYQSGDYHYRAEVQRGELAELLGLPLDVARNLVVSPKGPSGNIYASARYVPIPALSMETGVRWDFQSYGDAGGNHQQVSPRLSIRYDLTDQTSLRASAGRFYQSEGIHELKVTDGVSRFQGPQRADHYIVGVDHWFWHERANLRVEAFAKYIDPAKRRFENLFDSLTLLPELGVDRIEIAPRKARAGGYEISLNVAPSETLQTWLSYGRATASDLLAEGWVPRTWDQRDTARAGFVWNPQPWSLALTGTWHSGWKTTRLPREIDEIEPLTFKRNRSRLPYFLSVDVRASRTWEWSAQSLMVFAEVTNILNRNNSGAVGYGLDIEDEDEAADPEHPAIDITREYEALVPLVPSVGFVWKFY